MDAFEAAELIARSTGQDERYQEFLRVPSLSMGLYSLPAGSTDTQQPHEQDEVYIVIKGRGQILVDSEDQVVGPGSIVYVPKQIEHRFHSITEALHILVLFAPAENAG